MSLDQKIKERIENALQSPTIDHRFQYALTQLLSEDDDALNSRIAYAARGKPKNTPPGFNYIAGDIYTARTTYTEFLTILETNEFYSFQLSQKLRSP